MFECLLEYSYRHSLHSSSRIDFELIKSHFGQDIADALTAGLKIYWRRTTPVTTQTGYSNELLIALTAELENDIDIISSFNPKEAAQAACIIASCARQNSIVWFDRLIEVHEPAVFEALHPWIETENQSTIKFVLDCSCQTRVKLLQPIIPLVKNGEIQNVELLFSLAKTLHEDGQLSSADITNLCKAQVKRLDSDQQIKEIHWLCLWLETDIVAAWNWFEEHLNQIGKNVNKQLEAFARTSGYESPYWLQMQPDQIDHTADVLIALFNRLNAYISSAKEAGENKKVHPRESIPELRHHIVKMLVQTPGQTAHNILTQLADTGP